MKKQETLNELALFAGIGGGILGGKLLGWRCVCAVEIDAYCRDRLMQRQDEGHLDPFPIWDDVRTFDGRPWAGRVDVISGGFPCQDISVAGKGAGIDGERSGLWSEFARIIGEVRPKYVLVENSPAIIYRGLGRVLGDLASMGYDAQWGVLGAADAIHDCGIAAKDHQRNRIWIVAENTKNTNPCGKRLQGVEQSFALRKGSSGWEQRPHGSTAELGEIFRLEGWEKVSYAGDCGCEDDELFSECSVCGQDYAECPCPGPNQEEFEYEEFEGELYARRREPEQIVKNWWATEPELGRVAHGVANRVDRLKAIGNGQVPAVVRLAWEILNESEQK